MAYTPIPIIIHRTVTLENLDLVTKFHRHRHRHRHHHLHFFFFFPTAVRYRFLSLSSEDRNGEKLGLLNPNFQSASGTPTLSSVLSVAVQIVMGFSKTEINMRRLLNAAPRQQNQTKLVHYVATLRELLEQLVAESTPEGLPRVSKAMVNDYSEKIEQLAAKLAPSPSDMPGALDAVDRTEDEQMPVKTEDTTHLPSPILRRRLVSHPKVEDINHEITEAGTSSPVKLDAAAHAHIEKHRKLQEDLTDEMVGLARQLKESSLTMNQSLEDTEKLLDSTEKAVEHSLASTGHANARAMEIYSQSFKTTCFTWLMIFLMTCIFIMVVLLIRVT